MYKNLLLLKFSIVEIGEIHTMAGIINYPNNYLNSLESGTIYSTVPPGSGTFMENYNYIVNYEQNIYFRKI